MARSLVAAAAAGLVLVHGTPHADRLSTANGKRESVTCAAGRDLVVADAFDRVARDCETLSVRLSVDPTTGPAQHRTEVEPSAAAFGSTAVAVFQVGRFESGGAEAIGFAASHDAGRSWRSGLLPGLTVGGGAWTRASDPVVAYDAVHDVWLAATLALAPTRNSVSVSRSADGFVWSAPVAAADAPSPIAYDKEWIACDNWPASPRRGSCYLQWTDVKNGGLVSQTSHDGGQTWSPPVAATAAGFGAQPVVQPDGTLVTVLLTDAQDSVLAVRSTDGGASFSSPVQVSDVRFVGVRGLRVPPLPSAAGDAGGLIVVAWSDCRFRAQCTGDDLAVSTSSDGVSWSPAARAAAGADASAVVPGLGAGAAGRFAVTYYASGPSASGVRTAESLDGGRTWSPPRRLDAVPVTSSWLPLTEGGRFFGDYIATPFLAGRPLPVFSLALGPHNQSIFAAVRS
jgi:BNR/Asp-box repeat